MPSLPVRSKYDSLVIYLYANRKEHLLPEHFKKSIPHSTASTWRNIDYGSYLGQEYRYIQNESLEWYDLLHEHRKLKTIIRTIAKVWISFSVCLPHIKKNYQELLINEIQKLSSILPLKKSLNIFRLSLPAYKYQLTKLSLSCARSPFGLCLKKHPLQLSYKEVRILKNLLTDSSYACWPVSSIAHYARRKGLLYIAPSTWYKYSCLLGIKKKFPKPEMKSIGIRASRPNEFLHVDTTFYRMEDEGKRAITFVSDNFSKNILGWSIALRHGAENVKVAIGMALENIRKFHPDLACSTLVADGGSENHAVTIKELLEETRNPQLTKVIALKDIAFSNSPIEAINKIMKRYLRYYNPSTDQQLYSCISNAVEDYCMVRPHASIHGYTPAEVYSGNIPCLDFSTQTSEARKVRVLINKNGCGQC